MGPRQMTGAGFLGQKAALGALSPAVYAEDLGNRGAGDVRVQDSDLEAPAAHDDSQLAGDHGLADAALAGHHAVDLAHAGIGVVLFQKRLGLLAFGTAFAAGGAVVGTFAHE